IRIRGSRWRVAIRHRFCSQPRSKPAPRYREGLMSTIDKITTGTLPSSSAHSIRPRRTSRRPTTGRGLLYLTLVALLVIFILPMLWALSGSFKPRGDIFATPPSLIPNPATRSEERRVGTERGERV